uniref:SERTA domain-containing protein 2-like n=1 Tax=Cynoglossus semilaevis TaxID=244447 RepID=A0A3P8V581_CYNSE
MITKGQKRKYSPEEVEATDRSNPIWESQRQFVFSVSLNKYQRGQELPEPSLRRSVLIANTLRQMMVTNSSSALTTCSGEWESMSTDGDFSLSAAISSILTALDSNIEESPQAVQRTPFQSLENLSRSSEDKDKLFGLRGCGVGHPAGDDLPRYLLPISPSASSSQYLSNQNLKCLPSFSSFGPLSSSPASLPTIFSPSSSLFPGQNQGLDLEHLMEILVES